MSFYDRYVLPHLIDFAMRNRELGPHRERLISRARGRVLEIGIGSGLNLPFYRAGETEVIALEPGARLLAMAQAAARRIATPVRFIAGSAECIPLKNGSIDTVVTTWTLCSIPDVIGALREMRRVLKPDGRLLFVEHGLAPDARVQQWQNRLTPVWKSIAGGCRLNRPMRALIEQGGFRIEKIDTGYIKGPKLLTFFYEGSARPR